MEMAYNFWCLNKLCHIHVPVSDWMNLDGRMGAWYILHINVLVKLNCLCQVVRNQCWENSSVRLCTTRITLDKSTNFSYLLKQTGIIGQCLKMWFTIRNRILNRSHVWLHVGWVLFCILYFYQSKKSSFPFVILLTIYYSSNILGNQNWNFSSVMLCRIYWTISTYVFHIALKYMIYIIFN